MSLVTMRFSAPGFRYAFQLPDEVALVAAGTESHFSHVPGESGADALVLTVDIPSAPEGAAEVLPVYHSEKPGVFDFECFRWYRADGTMIEAAVEAPK